MADRRAAATPVIRCSRAATSHLARDGLDEYGQADCLTRALGSAIGLNATAPP